MKLLSAVILLALVGCTTIGHNAAPADWPQLEIKEHYVGFLEMESKCYKYLSLPMKLLGGIAFGCSEINFAAKRCDIWVFSPTPETLKHEREHCQGLDHLGDRSLADMWEHFKNSK